jgi:hypothetical protein
MGGLLDIDVDRFVGDGGDEPDADEREQPEAAMNRPEAAARVGVLRDRASCRAIAACDSFSDRCSGRISAQSSTVITLQSKGAHFRPGTTCSLFDRNRHLTSCTAARELNRGLRLSRLKTPNALCCRRVGIDIGRECDAFELHLVCPPENRIGYSTWTESSIRPEPRRGSVQFTRRCRNS